MFSVCQKYLLTELVSLFQLNAHNCPVTLFSAVNLSMQLWYKQRQRHGGALEVLLAATCTGEV